MRVPERRSLGGLSDPAGISALAAIFNSPTSPLVSSVSMSSMQRSQDRREILAKRISYCEELYSDFVVKARTPSPMLSNRIFRI